MMYSSTIELADGTSHTTARPLPGIELALAWHAERLAKWAEHGIAVRGTTLRVVGENGALGVLVFATGTHKKTEKTT